MTGQNQNTKQEPHGIIVVLDPHVDDRSPSSRLDNYSEHVLGKLSYCRDIAIEENYLMAVAGDCMNRPHIQSDHIKGVLMDIFWSMPHRPMIWPGNHDMSGDVLAPVDTLWMIGKSRSANIYPTSGCACVMKMVAPETGRTITVGIGGTPYGQEIPKSVDWPTTSGSVDFGVWFTHHNLKFQTHYVDKPSYDFHPILGVDIVVNGHLHHHAPEVMRVSEDGSYHTTWYNPGSTTRTKASEKERVPTAMIIHANGTLEILPISYDGSQSVFSAAAGRASAPTPLTQMTSEDDESARRFVAGLIQRDDKDVNVGELLDEERKAGRINDSERAFLEEVSSEAASRIGL